MRKQIHLSDVQIPAGCTHWTKVSFDKNKPTQHRFYKVLGPENDIIFIWFQNKWTKFEDYQDWVIDHTPCKHKIKVPNFNTPFFNRHEETANDKIQQVKERIEQC